MVTQILVLSSLLAAAPAAVTPRVFHLPITEAQAGEPLTLRVIAAPALGMDQVFVWYRRAGDTGYEQAPLVRVSADEYVADLPAGALRQPGLEYFIAGESGPFAGDRFASRTMPHRVAVGDETARDVFEARLAAHDGKRSRVRVGGGYVDFGTRDFGPNRFPDRYYFVQVDFTYRILGTLESLRFGGVRLRGDGVLGPVEMPLAGLEAVAAGYDYGFGEVGVAVHRVFGLFAELQLGANDEGFSAGAKGTVRIGPELGTHVRLWAGGTGGVGYTTGLTLAWNTVPSVPMSATVEATSWPTGAVGSARLLYDATFEVTPGLRLQPRVSYQARGAQFGGAGVELFAGYAF